MNKARRKAIEDALALLVQAREALDAARDEEQDYYDNMPESFQGGDKGAKAQEAIVALEEAVNACEEAEQACETAKE